MGTLRRTPAFLTGVRQPSCLSDNCHLSRREVLAVISFARYKLVEIKIYYMVRKFKRETLDRTLWINRFGRGCGPITRQTVSEWTNESVTWTNAVYNADHGNNAVESAARYWASFALGSHVRILSAALTVVSFLCSVRLAMFRTWNTIACVS